jgi:GNAT superfamily N-acetyltransferase
LKFTVGFAGPDDVPLLVSHRLKMWEAIHPEWKSKIRASEGLTRKWIKGKLAGGDLIGFVARAPEGAVAGSGCIWVREEQPRPTSPRLRTPYLMSMYTERRFRRKGVARLVVRRAIRWCRDHNYERMTLNASSEGRALYEALGFEQGNEMRLRL